MYRANPAWKVLKESLNFLKKNNIIQEREKAAGIMISLVNYPALADVASCEIR